MSGDNTGKAPSKRRVTFSNSTKVENGGDKPQRIPRKPSGPFLTFSGSEQPSVSAPASSSESGNAVTDSRILITEINQFLVKIQEKANGLKSNNTNKLSEVLSMIQKLENDIKSVSELIPKIGIHYPSYLEGIKQDILKVTTAKNSLQRKVNSIINPAAVVAASVAVVPAAVAPASAAASTSLPPLPPSGPSFFQNLTLASASASASASGPKSVSLHVPALSQGKQAASQPSVSQPSVSGKLEARPAAGPKIVRLVRKREDNGTLTYTATIVQSSMLEQLPKNTSWKTPGGVSVPALTVNPLFNPPSKGGRKRTHKRAHCAQSHKRK